MADCVVRLDGLCVLGHEVRGDKVVLKIDGRAGGKHVRAEIALDVHDITAVAVTLREGTKTQVNRWLATQRSLGTGE